MCSECIFCIEEQQPKSIKIKWCLINITWFSHNRVRHKACAKIYASGRNGKNRNTKKLIIVPKTSRAKTFWNDKESCDNSWLDENIITHKIKVYDDYLCCIFF